MGVKDTVTKDYMNDPYIFADAFNYFLYNGESVILPDKLHPLDTTAISVPYGANDAGVPVQKFRDGMKYFSGMTDDTVAYLLLGVELQSEVHYAMPVKDMVYDALQYAAQVEEAAKTHRREIKERKKAPFNDTKEKKKPNSGEYLSGFYKEDKLIPTVTLVIFFSSEKWDAPVRLHEMFAISNEKILEYIPDYKINLIIPEKLSEAQLDQFHTSLREVLLFIKYSKDKEKLYNLVERDARFHNIEQKAGRVINAITGAGLKMDESEEYIDMCKAIQDMREEAMQAGKQEGQQEGRQKEKEEIIIRMLNKKIFTYGEIAEIVKTSEEKVKEVEVEMLNIN